MPRLTLPLDLTARLAARLGRSLAADEPVAVAVSGGPDSMALLWLAADAWPGRVLALTVDHGLRPAAAAEAALVADHCARHGITHRTLVWTGAKPAAGMMAAARAARYALLADACVEAGARVLLTAHHADDQAETLLMRLARGAGPGGLAGIRPARPLAAGVLLVRPLLDVRRVVLRDVVEAAGWPTVADPTNFDPRYLRSRARVLLDTTDWLDPATIADAAAHLAAAEDALAWAVERAWAGGATMRPGEVCLDAADLPAVLRLRLAARAVAALAPAARPRGPELARLIERLAAGGTATLAGVRARARDGLWHFTLAPPRRDSRGKSS